MAIFRLKYRDTMPILLANLKKSDGTGADITGSTGWKLHIELSNGTVLTRDMVKVADNPAQLSYAWTPADWDVGGITVGPDIPLAPGVREHRMEYEVLGPGGARQTYPNEGFDTLRVWKDIAQG